MDVVKERLIQFAKNQGIPKMEFYKKISVVQSNFSGRGGESALSTDKIMQILMQFPELNSDWLLLGRGEMLRKNNPANEKIYKDIIADKDRQLADANQAIGALRKELHDLKEKLNSSSQTAISL